MHWGPADVGYVDRENENCGDLNLLFGPANSIVLSSQIQFLWPQKFVVRGPQLIFSW